jgi:succinate dehydrogenase/fumarate reductase-like Fe-S protein
MRLPDVNRGHEVLFLCDGDAVPARAGETVAAALLAAGHRTLRRSPRSREARGLFCAMGICFDCVMKIDGQTGLRACLTPVRDGMVVDSL